MTYFKGEGEMGKQGQVQEDVCEEQENDAQKRNGKILSEREKLGDTSIGKKNVLQ